MKDWLSYWLNYWRQHPAINDWLQHFLVSLLDNAFDIALIITITIGFQLLVIRKPLAHVKKLIIGFIYVLLGLSLFVEGLNMTFFPLGKIMAAQLTSSEFLGITTHTKNLHWKHYYWVYAFAASLGFATTLAEPSLLAVAQKAEQISGGAIRAWRLRIAVSLGVAFGIALGTYRIVMGTELYYYLVCGYILVLIQTLFAPKIIIGIAYDAAGGVNTSTVAVPLVTALGFGLGAVIPQRNPLLEGFGLVAFASLFPIIAVLAYAQLALWREKQF
ncbi:MAG: DUF1538 domain-containing protein [Methylococcaceae bacterium]